MSNFGYFLKRNKNKIGAVTFLGLGLACYLGFYLAIEIISGWTYFRSEPITVWNFMVALVCYLYLLITNIRNDNAAYTGIFMFISLIVLEGVFTIVDTVRLRASLIFAGNAGVSASFIGYCVLLATNVVIGILFYIATFRYMSGRSSDFKKLWIYGLLFGFALLINVASLMVFYGYAAVLTSPTSVLLACAIPFSELLVAIGIVFTLLRLKRL